jgi:hypothetical protein
MQNRAYGPDTPTESAASNTQGPEKTDHYMLRIRIKRRSGAFASSRQDTDYARAGGGQEFRLPVDYGRSGHPEIGVYTSRFEGRNLMSGLASSRARSSPTETCERA